MKKNFKTISKCFVVCAIFICSLCFSVFADLVEIKNGVKTTYVDKPRTLIDTIDKHYSFKWALDKKGDWKLYIRRLNGKLLNLSNSWVNLDRTIIDENGVPQHIVDYYYFDYYEKMVTGWLVDNVGNTYFLNTDPLELGRLARGWVKIGDDYYYFDNLGVLAKNTITVDGFYVDEEGRWK
jgi:glucan-binding YG repeat protein